MGTGYTRNDTSNNIAAGNVINASDLDGEFDAIVDAFNATTGHTHDGTAAEGGPITVIGPAQDYVGGAADFSPKTDSAYDLGTTSLRWASAYVDDLTLTNALPVAQGGTASTTASAARTALGLEIGTDVQAYDAFLDDIAALTDPNADRLLFWDDSAGGIVWLTLGTNLSITGTTLNASGATGGDAWSDPVDADIIPDADSTRDLGNTSTRFAEAYIDSLTLTNALPVAQGGTGSTTAAGARTNLGLGSLATASTINNDNWSGTDLALANGGTGASLVDPNADRILFWDDSAGATTWLTVGTGLSISGTTLTATAAAGDAWSDPVDADIIPDTNATRDLGSTSNRFADAFITSLTLTNDLPVTDGGTGASTASGARTNLGLGAAATKGVTGADANAVTGTAGTSGNVATWNADGDIVDGGYPPGAMVFIESQDASSSATLDFTGFDATKYDAYVFEIQGLVPATDDVAFQMRTSTDGGSTYDSAASDYQYVRQETRNNPVATVDYGDPLSAAMTLIADVGSDTGEDGVNMTVRVLSAGLAKKTAVLFQGTAMGPTAADHVFVSGAGTRLSSADVDAVRFYFSIGNIESGTITMYGLRNS